MTSQILDYVSAGAALAPVVHAVWSLPPVADLRLRARLRHRAAAHPPAPGGSAHCDAAALAAQVLKSLPAGTSVHYEGPDGCRLTVWRIPGPPEHTGRPEEYGLW
ncbi:hypothetical protein [Streptomyces sp. NBC_01530]|uniref:hypothetical protein n=1 Tax=Streptomyces sp. NBC_01530 TaxID=2903895 RepID=UPI00386489E8